MEPTKPVMSQKEYLKRYLMKDPNKKAKKKKKKQATISSSSHLKRSVIIDDDVNLNDLVANDEGELDLDQLGDEAPQIVGIVDERPEEIKLEEKFKSGKWRPLGESNNSDDNTATDERGDGGNREGSNVPSDWVDESRTGRDKIRRSEKKSSRREGKSDDSDMDVPRRGAAGSDSDMEVPRRRKGGSDSDVDVQRKRKTGSDSDLEVPRRRKNGGDSDFEVRRNKSGSVRGSTNSPNRRKSENRRKDDDSDQSPPRRDRDRRHADRHDKSPTRPKTKDGSDLDVRRKRRGSSDSDTSSSRHRHPKSKEGYSRKEYVSSRQRTNNGDLRSHSSLARKENRRDNSPPRKRDRNTESKKRRNDEGNDSDLSPPRRRKSDDSDLSPPRKINSKNSTREDQHPRSERLDKMGDGKKSGLQDAQSLKDELRALKEKEDEMFRKMDPEMLGARSAAVVRDRKTGLKRDFEKEREIERQKAAKESVRRKKYEKWGKGLKQIRDQQENVAELLHEMSKPLARYADDDDLERALKAQEREGDPMLDYIRRHQKESHSIDLTVDGVKKKYMGSYLPNRFNIAPGHRWDGVDRSNGYEQKWFAAKNAKMATAEEAWKWSSADM